MNRKLIPLFISLIALTGCESQNCPTAPNSPAAVSVCEKPVIHTHAYETWSPESGLMHIYDQGLYFDLGEDSSKKYLERKGFSPWVEPELISAETARKEKLLWAADRYVRWLGSTTGTIHFPFYPDEWEGDLYVEVGLRPKMNQSMAVRFYKPDGNGGRTWSEPLTTNLSPGYNGYRWKVPREYLSKDGMQLMRVSFPGSFFEGENRVSAKFSHIALRVGDLKTGKFALEPRNAYPEKYRILNEELDGFGLLRTMHLERFFIVPTDASLSLNAAPGAYLDTPGDLVVKVQTDGAEPEEVSKLRISPGECWKPHTVDLSAYGGKAARLTLSFAPEVNDTLFTPTDEFRPDIYISSPQLLAAGTDELQKAETAFKGAKRIVILGIDTLRADRLYDENKTRASEHLGKMASDGMLGLLMGEGKSLVAMATSMLTSVSADVHNVYEPGAYVKNMLTTLAEAASPLDWKTYFYTTSGIVDTSHGFSQGFDVLYALNKENITETGAALDEVMRAFEDSPERSLFYVHLSELRLPHRVDAETLAQYAVPGYNGPVNEAALNNIAVMREPGPLDARQYEAYYDAELKRVDDAVGAFVSKLGEDTVVIVYGTHGTSVGESTLGYEQGITPWELLTPYIIYRPEHPVGIRLEDITSAADLSASVLELIGAEAPAGAQPVFTRHVSHPIALYDGLSATAAGNWFYRIKREGVDALFTAGMDGTLAKREDSTLPITKQALREMIE
ncbi:MAG: sulfatase-like hydrolase/transferase [Proteobacteria bacterium]|nr:sulfatase-like hydrolase/transferase [Pseudomonadota bacterium]